MAAVNRENLKKYFLNGSLPTEGSFEDLIESCVNIVDDGIDKTDDNGLMLSPIEDHPVVSYYENIQDPDPLWTTSVENADENTGLNFNEPANADGSRLFLQNGGRIGVNTLHPQFALDTRGWSSMQGRTGTIAGEVPADRQWHTILSGLNHAQAYEIVARTGVTGTGKHCLIHATALSTYGKSRAKIRKTRALYSFWKPCNIKLRWQGTTYDYRLEIKCTRNLGEGANIRYFITQLWDDTVLGNVDLNALQQSSSVTPSNGGSDAPNVPAGSGSGSGSSSNNTTTNMPSTGNSSSGSTSSSSSNSSSGSSASAQP
ncbi:MAG: hypothetical protein ACFB10_16685 [Salibacteraceae bacterium]